MDVGKLLACARGVVLEQMQEQQGKEEEEKKKGPATAASSGANAFEGEDEGGVITAPQAFAKKIHDAGYELSSDSDTDSDSDSDSSSCTDTEDENGAASNSNRSNSGNTRRRQYDSSEDMTSYLPSVERGSINVTKAMSTLPGWRPRVLRTWLQQSTKWYAEVAPLGVMRSDPVAAVRKVHAKMMRKMQSSRGHSDNSNAKVR